MQEALGPRTSVFLSDVETDVWAPGLVNELASRSARWLITRGEFGADEVVGNASVHLPPEKVTLQQNSELAPAFSATQYHLPASCRVINPIYVPQEVQDQEMSP